MELLDTGWGYEEYWTDQVDHQTPGAYGILFCDDYPDEKFLDLGIISERPTNWYIGRSRQNDVTNIHVSGSIYTSDQFTPDPYYRANDSHVLQWRGHEFCDFCSWKDEVKWFRNYRYDQFADGSTQVYSLGYHSYRHGNWYFYLWIGYYHYYDADGKEVSNNVVQDYYPYASWRYMRSEYPSSRTDTRSYQQVRCHVRGNLETGDYQIIWPSDWSWIENYLPRPSGVTSSIDVDVKLVSPPRNGTSYDVSFPDNSYHWDEAFAESLSQVDFTTSNGIAYALDAKDLGHQLKGDFEALRSLAKGTPGKLKIAAGLFLSFHYGYSLMASDTAEFAGVLNEYSKQSNRRVHTMIPVDQTLPKRGGMILESAIAHQSVYYDPYGQLASETLKLAEALDVVPDFSNIWDMIPFSFVVDWFTNVGDLAEGIDAFFTLSQQHKVLGTIRSTKEVYRYHIDAGVGEYQYTIYKRWCIKDWYPIPEFSFQVKNPVTNLVHWAEAGSLVVATRP